jgi:biopolymer transport protein TolQ
MPQAALQTLSKAAPMPTGAPTITTVPQASVQTTELATNAAAAAAPQVQTAADVAAAPAAATMDAGLSLWDMFWKADFIVMVVMLLLIAASVWTWTIVINKVRKIRALQQQAEAFEEAFWSGGSLDQLYERVNTRVADPMTAVFSAAMREWRRSVSKGGAVSSDLKATLHQRIERIMQVTIGREMEAIERQMGFLASVGSTAPFVGLFGTVWGIMNSFHAIAQSQNTSLAVVAPGIAEALFVTALGLVAAIPAMISYNKISADLDRYGNRLDTFASEFGSIISRQLEEGV